MKIDTESKMKFDDSIETEDRFAIRKWFQKFIDFQNNNDVEALQVILSPECVFDGWTRRAMDPETYCAYQERRAISDTVFTVRYPELQFRKRGQIFRVSGSFEEYHDGGLIMEGMVDIKIELRNKVFQLVKHKFIPRLIIRTE